MDSDMTALTRRRLLRGAIATAGAAVVASVEGVQRVLGAASDDNQPVITGGQYDDISYPTLLQNQTVNSTVLNVKHLLGGAAIDAFSGSGRAVSATSVSGNGVYGENSSDGTAVYGKATGSAGNGVVGEANSATNGYGGQFSGGKAQMRLVPRATSGKPTGGSHLPGEIYVDSRGAIFICTAAGTPGTWRKVRTAAT